MNVGPKSPGGQWVKTCSWTLFSWGAQRVINFFRSFRRYRSLRWGWVFLERTRILSGIQFTTYFIETFVVETKQFVGIILHVILTRQTCGQRSRRAAESKRWAIGNYFSKRTCYMFIIPKCRRDRDLSLCTTSVLAFEELQCTGKIREKKCVLK